MMREVLYYEFYYVIERYTQATNRDQAFIQDRP